jgi:uncharacterized membrane protein YgdD (TMEM256/DUF423 family)
MNANLNANPTSGPSSAASVHERLAAVLVFLSIALGAMGAHAFKVQLESTPKGMELWKTAAQYHGLHAVALYFLAGKSSRSSWWCLFCGVVIFSGTLYVLAITNLKWLGAITPVGGVLMMVGWLLMAFRKSKQ